MKNRKEPVKGRWIRIALLFAMMCVALVSAQSAQAAVKVKTPVVKSVSGDKNVVTVRWKKLSKAKGYQVYYREKGKKYQKGASVSKNRVTLYGLKPNTVYSFKVRAYRKVNGKYYYGSFSKPVKLKTKKEKTKKVATLKEFLQNAVQPLGTTLYVWGGGWGPSGDTLGGDLSARTIGVSAKWEEFFQSQDAGYSYTSTMYQSELGLDCSGYVGWCVYNTLNTVSGNNGYVELAQNMAKDFSKKGWGTYTARAKVKDWKPGDIMSSDCTDCGHVWISLGTCSDGSVVVLHSTSSGGVQISGTPTPEGKNNSEAVQLAMRYMRRYCVQWSERYSVNYKSHLKGSSYLSHYAQMRWDVSGSSILTDPDGYQDMTPVQVLEDLLGPA